MSDGETRVLTGPGQGLWRACCAALLALACLLCAPLAKAQNVATGAGNAQAVIVAPLSLIKVADMDFGKILPSASGGTVTIEPMANACQTSAGVLEFGTCRAARFVGMGTKKMQVRFTLPNSINLTGPGTAMLVDEFTIGATASLVYNPGPGNGGGNKRWEIQPASGLFDFGVGATLHVNPNQKPGVYTGTFSITAHYN
jgi:hypothetical protein